MFLMDMRFHQKDKRYCKVIATQKIAAVLHSKIQKAGAVGACISVTRTYNGFEINFTSRGRVFGGSHDEIVIENGNAKRLSQTSLLCGSQEDQKNAFVPGRCVENQQKKKCSYVRV